MDRMLVSRGYKVSIYSSFLHEKLHEINLGETYVSCFAGYKGKVLLGTVSGDLILLGLKSFKTKQIINLKDTATGLGYNISNMGFDGHHLYLIAHGKNKTFYVFDQDLNLEKKINLSLPQFSSLDVGPEALAGSYDGDVYRYSQGNLESVVGTTPSVFNKDAVKSIKQLRNKLYVGLVKGALRIYEDYKKIKEIKFDKEVHDIAKIGDLLFVGVENNLYKMKDDEIIARRTLKKHQTIDFVRNLQHAKIQNNDYLVFLYHNDIHFLNKNLRTKFVKLTNDSETIWGVYCC